MERRALKRYKKTLDEEPLDALRDALKHEFQRNLYCVRKTDGTLQLHNWFYRLCRELDKASAAYNTIKCALEACYRDTPKAMSCYYAPRPIILQVYTYFKRILGRDLARLITNESFAPTPQEMIQAGRAVLRRVSTVSNCSLAYTRGFLWGDVLIFDIIKRVS